MSAALTPPSVTTMEPAEAVSIARARLLHDKPFYGHLLASAEARLQPSLKAGLATTMDTFGRFYILYNPARWTMPDTPIKSGWERTRLSELSPEERRAISAKPRVPWTIVELAGGLEHECHHILQMHHSRGVGLDKGAWRLGTDVAINQNLTHLPSFAIDHRTYGLPPGLAAEAYYVDLLKQHGDDDQPDGGSGSGGGGPDDGQGHGGQDPADDEADAESEPETTCDPSAWQPVQDYPERFERRVAAIAKEALSHCKDPEKLAGYVPGGLLDKVKRRGRVKQRCREFLLRFGQSCAAIAMRPTRRRPNRRYGWDQPGLRVRGKAVFAVIIDTSGSVGRDYLARFFAHLDCWAAFADLVVIQIDGKVQSIEKHKRGVPEMEFRGRGGTVLDEAFEVVAGRCKRTIPNRRLLRGVRGALILTDGDLVRVPDKNPVGVDVMWVFTPGAKKMATWGNHVHLDKEDSHGSR